MDIKGVDHCLLYWHGPGDALELTPMADEAITYASLDNVKRKLDELSSQGWRLITMTATRGQWMYVLTKKPLGPRLPTLTIDVSSKSKKKKKKGNK